MNSKNQPTRKSAVIVFLKKAEAGKVKTRLGTTLGDEKALEIYKLLVAGTIKILKSLEAEIYLYYYPEIDLEASTTIPTHFKKCIQKGMDLGEKMDIALQDILTKHQKVVLIGSDCPYLTSEILNQAFSALDTSEVVLGPSKDGGYYLVGMKETYSYIFQNIAWSTNTVLKETLQRINDLKLSVHLLVELSDIDYESDWLMYQAHIAG